MRYLLLSLFLFLSIDAQAQAIKRFDVVQRGYWRVVLLGDTLPGQYDRYDTALKRAYDAARDSTGAGSIQIIPPQFTFHFDKEPLVLQTIPDSLRLKTVSDYFSAIVDTPNPDTSDYVLEIIGEYPADNIRITAKCYDSTSEQTVSGYAERARRGWVWRKQMQCNGIATYWIQVDGVQQGIGFVDIAHRRYIGSLD